MKWTRLLDRTAEIAFWRVAGQSLQTGHSGACPHCGAVSLRHYAHHFGPGRSALWVWCRSCTLWTALSNIRIEAEFHDPYVGLSPDEFEAMECNDWIARLDQLWETHELPGRG